MPAIGPPPDLQVAATGNPGRPRAGRRSTSRRRAVSEISLAELDFRKAKAGDEAGASEHHRQSGPMGRWTATTRSDVPWLAGHLAHLHGPGTGAGGARARLLFATHGADTRWRYPLGDQCWHDNGRPSGWLAPPRFCPTSSGCHSACESLYGDTSRITSPELQHRQMLISGVFSRCSCRRRAIGLPQNRRAQGTFSRFRLTDRGRPARPCGPGSSSQRQPSG